MALLSTIAYDLKGQEIATVVDNSVSLGQLRTIFTPGYVANGATPYLDFPNGSQGAPYYRSASTAIDKAGDVIQDVVDTSGVATEYVSLVGGGHTTTVLGSGVESVSVAFQPNGLPVSDVVFEDGLYYEYNSNGGATLISTNAVSASVAIDAAGDKIQDYVTTDSLLLEISTPASTGNPTVSRLGYNAVSSGVAFGPNGGLVHAIVFNNGDDYQYDGAGPHFSGQIFLPVTQMTAGSVDVAFNPSGQEIATIGFPTGDGSDNFYQFTGTSSTADGTGTSRNVSFTKAGVKVEAVANYDGSAAVYFNGVVAFQGQGVQEISVAFDPSGHEFVDVVYQNGDYYEFDDQGHATLIASDVISAGVAISSTGQKLQDYATADGVAHEINDGATTTLGTNVVSIGVAFDGNGGAVRSVLFTDGLAYQYDSTGQHLQGQVFDPSLVNPNRMALVSKLPPIVP